MTSRGPQEGNIMNFWEGDSEVKLHLALLSISEWKSNGKTTKIQHHPHNHWNQLSISKSSRFRIILKIIQPQHTLQNPHNPAPSSKSSNWSIIFKSINFKSTLVKVPGYACNGLVISGIRCESPGTCWNCRLREKPKWCLFSRCSTLFLGKRENSSLLCWSLPIMFVSNCTNLGPRELYIHIYFKLNKMRGLIQGKAGMSSSNLGMSWLGSFTLSSSQMRSAANEEEKHWVRRWRIHY